MKNSFQTIFNIFREFDVEKTSISRQKSQRHRSFFRPV